ncbi:MAG: lyase domain protein repeat-containing protein [Labilithrix sp.]|nr:lyase domain protein repeat-containing protein [Labilithrix sp.]
MSTAKGFFDLRPGERRNTFAALATLLLVTTGHTLLETARDAFFLAKMPASQLPWMYLAMVALALLLSQLRVARADSKGGIAVALVVGAVITTGFWTTMRGGTARSSILYALYVWTGLFGSWTMVQIWTLLGRAYTMTQAKRLYGLIGSGAVLGGVLGAALARVTIGEMSPRSAVLMASGIFLLAVVPCWIIKLPRQEKVVAPRRGTEVAARRPVSASATLIWENAFARRVLYIVLVSTITVTVADFLFKSQMAAHFTSTRELGNWLSSFTAVSNTVALFAQVAIAPWVFRRAGVQRGLLVFPVSMLLGAGGVILGGGAFLAAVLLKAVDGALRYSIHKTSTELLLVPVPDGMRERIKPIIDVVGSRGGQAVASLGILGLVAVGGAATHPQVLGVVVFGLAFMWLVLVVSIRALYLDVFRETLRSGGISGKAELPELDLGALETLFAGLNSSRDSEVIGSLELLAEQHRERLIPALILYHPSRDVVLRALDLFQEMGRTDFIPIADRLNRHPDREVAAAALRARTAVQPSQSLLLTRLADSCAQVSVTALVALMARGWMDAADAEARLSAALASRSAETAAELARAVRTVALKRGADDAVEDRFDRLLLELDALAPELERTEDGHDGKEPANEPAAGERHPSTNAVPPEIRVRLEVARAMAVRRSPTFLPALVRMLSRHELRAVARAAIVTVPGAFEAITEAMSSTQLPRQIRIHLPRTIALFEPSAAAAVLLHHLETTTEGAVRFKALRGLLKIHRNNPDLRLDETVLARLAESTLKRIEELRRWGIALSSGGDNPAESVRRADPLQAAHHLLVDLVKDKEVHATQRLFLLLELINGDPFDDIWRGLRSKNLKSRASSLELLENLVQEPLRARVLALVGEPVAVTDLERPPRVSLRPSQELLMPLTYAEAILEIVARSSSTMRTLAEYRAAELGLDLSGIVRRAPEAPAPSPLASSLGGRLLDKVTDMLTPDEPVPEPRRVPA